MGIFEERLDYIYYAILGMLRFGIDELNIRVNENNMKKFQEYFFNDFYAQYRNKFVEIKVESV